MAMIDMDKLTDDEKRILAQHEAMHRALFAKTFNPLDEYRADIPRTPVMHDLLYGAEVPEELL